MDWYYTIEGEKQGPISGADLKKLADARELKPSDLVWREGLADWIPARKVKGLIDCGSKSADDSGEAAVESPSGEETPKSDSPVGVIPSITDKVAPAPSGGISLDGIKIETRRRKKKKPAEQKDETAPEKPAEKPAEPSPAPKTEPPTIGPPDLKAPISAPKVGPDVKITPPNMPEISPTPDKPTDKAPVITTDKPTVPEIDSGAAVEVSSPAAPVEIEPTPSVQAGSPPSTPVARPTPSPSEAAPKVQATAAALPVWAALVIGLSYSFLAIAALVGVVLFLVGLTAGEGAEDTTALGVFFSTLFIAAFILAGSVEKIVRAIARR